MAHRYDEYRDDRDMSRGERGFSRDDRGPFERAGDEVRSWFGDDDAERRRRMDEDRARRERMTSERGWTGERWEGADRWRGEPDRWRGESDRWRSDFDRPPRSAYGRPEWDRSGAAARGWNELEYGYRPSWGYGPGEWSTGGDWRYADRSRRERSWESPDRGMGESRGIYETDRGRVYQFQHGPEMSFAGRGPKGYRRSDDRIREDVCDRLTDDWRIDASDVEVVVTNGEVTLSGAVHSRDDKRSAEDLAETISGVRDVHNNLRVSRWQDTGQGAGAGLTTAPTATTGAGAGPTTAPTATTGTQRR
jgi:osmotically-inducible protein OsmY